jgi:prepilin-type N-terminal cleavage/methylation domain-containing protein
MTQIKLQSRQCGFTLIETMIAITVLTIGILTVIAAFGSAVGSTENSENYLIAREKALQALESVFAARNDQQITFAQIANISNGGIFTNGAVQLLCAGPDGLVNTADDVNCPASGPCAAGPECIVLPGPDGILGTADDQALSLAAFTRTIQITQVAGYTNLDSVVVTITYPQAGLVRGQAYVVDALISSYR